MLEYEFWIPHFCGMTLRTDAEAWILDTTLMREDDRTSAEGRLKRTLRAGLLDTALLRYDEWSNDSG